MRALQPQHTSTAVASVLSKPATYGHAPQQKAPGLVLAAFRAALAALPQVAEAGGPSEMHMGCVMLHMELLRDLLSPQSRVKISESQTEGVQLEGLHWQSITDVKEAEGLLQLATQNKAVHTMQADNGFLDACHIITAIRIATGAPPAMSEAMASRIAGAPLTLLDAAHISVLEQPQAFAQELREFIAGRCGG